MSHQIRAVRLGGDRGAGRTAEATGRGGGRLLAMAGLGQLGTWRHGVVAATVLGGSALALTGLIGTPHRDETFEAKQITVTPVGENGLRIREVVDEDFGTADKHGYQRIIPNDFGVPTDVEATSPDAPDAVSVTDTFDGQTQIRIGDPNTTVSGQHRYVLTYTLPDARLTTGQLALDIIGTDETLGTDEFEVVVTGLELDDPLCNVGSQGASGGCTLAPDGATFQTVIAPLEAGQGVTIGGTIVGRTDAVDVPEPPIPDRRSDNNVPLAAAMLPLGAASAGGVYAWARRRGRNEVFAGGAADAAYGSSAPFAPPGSPPPPTRLVADEDMAKLATTEFVPPKGIDPWQGAVLMKEHIDDDSVSAWFSGQAAKDIITVVKDDGDVVLGMGPKYATAPAADAAILGTLFTSGPSVRLDGYDKDFATAWRAVRAEEERSIAESGYWKRMPPGGGGCSSALSLPVLIFAGFWLFIAAGSVLTALLGLVAGPIGALLFGLVVPALAAYAMYRSMLPARSATGSALAIRTESFRRFLAASEGRHVEWAWKQGLLREYSAWAVALGAASTWERAMEASSVPPVELSTGPLLFYSMGPSFTSFHTAPSTSGGSGGGFGGGGGFSGGSVGGGGGGGSSGSW
jgi:uncharacterized membrane protein YgcG